MRPSSPPSIEPAPKKPVERFFEFSLLGLLTSGYLAVAGSGHLDKPTILLTVPGLVLRALLVSGLVRFQLSNTFITVLTLLYIGFYPIDYAFLSRDFLRATVHLVFFLAVVKILTAKTNRDYFYIKIIAFLELLAACVLSSSLNFFVFLALFLLFAVATFSSSEVRRSTQAPLVVARGGLRTFGWRLAGLTVCVSIGILTMTAGLFFFLPRTARAAFQHLVSERYHLPGFSNEVTLGQIGEIKKQNTAIMHVRIHELNRSALGNRGMNRLGPPGISQPNVLHLKWRGAALTEFDGKRWFNPSSMGEMLSVGKGGLLRLADDRQRQRADGRRITYEVHLKDIASDALFFTGIPEFLQIDARIVVRSLSDSYHTSIGETGRLAYGAYSFLEVDNPQTRFDVQPRIPKPLTAAQRETCLRVPVLDSRIPQLTREITNPLPSTEFKARALENYLRERYGYTLDLPSSHVPDPLAHFLFERKKGHCEYFASALAVMLRTIAIPSRVVTGFQSGIFNPISGWQLIRASDAHSWVEAYLPNRGWTTFDPTPPDPNPPSEYTLFSKLALYIDAAEVFWQDWVLNYDLDRQVMLAARMEESSRQTGENWLDVFKYSAERWKPRALLLLERNGLTMILIIAFLGAALILMPQLRRWWQTRLRVRNVQRGFVKPTDATMLYLRMLNLLKGRGFDKPAWLTPSEFARMLPYSESSLVVEDLTSAYNELRYGGNRDAAPRMVRLLKRLEKMTD